MSYLTSPTKTTLSYVDNDVINGTIYYYQISAKDNAGNESTRTAQVEATYTESSDSTAPATPTNFTATGVIDQVNLVWSTNSELDLATYNIYRGTVLNGWMDHLNSISKDSTSYTDSAVINDTTYYYQISAKDNAGNASTRTTQVKATPLAPDTTPPATPTNVSATAMTGLVYIAWDSNSEPDLDYYIIYRNTNEGYNPSTNDIIISINQPITHYLDTIGLVPFTNYYYKVSAVDTVGNVSMSSNQASVVTLSFEDRFNIPLDFSLEQNFPNPFNPFTHIVFSIPQYVNVKIVIFDILGNRICELINDPLPAGEYSQIWDTTNDNGQPVVDGVYFYKIEAGDFVQTKKMVLLK